jgi:LysM repeat protein
MPILTKKIQLLLLFLIGFGFPGFSQNDPRLAYILKYEKLAVKEMSRSGIPASIILAQACLESGDGKGKLALMSNNHFGIKCKSGWEGESVLFDDDLKDECFRSYPTVEESFADHSRFLMQSPRYAWLFEFDHNDYKSWAKGLQKSGYATSIYYSKQLIKIIEDYGLHKLDRKWSEADIRNFQPLALNRNESEGLLVNPYGAHPVEIRNNLNTIVVKDGDSFNSIAEEFELKPWELYKFNDFPKGYKLRKNEIIYIQYKKKKASRNTPPHLVDSGETMQFISQLYGIRLHPLQRRNHFGRNQQPTPGELIKLR